MVTRLKPLWEFLFEYRVCSFDSVVAVSRHELALSLVTFVEDRCVIKGSDPPFQYLSFRLNRSPTYAFPSSRRLMS